MKKELIKDRKIIKESEKLEKLSNKISRYEKKRYSFSAIVKYKKKYAELSNELNRLIAERLIYEDETFKELAIANCAYLKKSNLVFKTTAEQMSLTGTHVTELKGRLANNGHISCGVKKTNLPIFNFLSRFAYASEFRGRIDCLGNVTLKKSETQKALFNRVPSRFLGEISELGELRVLTSECSEDFILSDGKNIISKIMSDFTFSSEENQDAFFENKKRLEYLIMEFRRKITATNKLE